MLKKFFVCLALLFLFTLQGAEAVNRNGIYVLSNPYLIAEINPAQGGKVIRLYDKKNKVELAKGFTSLEAPSGSGLFAERLWPLRGGQSRHYERTPYKVVSVKADKIAAELKLFCASKPLDIEKTYILNENEPVLRVRYALTNPGDQPFTGRFWSSSVIFPAGEKWNITLPKGPYSDNLRHKGPVTELTIAHDQKNVRPGNHWIVGPLQDYGCVNNTRSGAAIIAPFEFLELFYCHVPSGGNVNLPTLEWMSSYLHIKPLAVGKADAVNHPELEDPLQDYIVRFETSLSLCGTKNLKAWRPVSKVRKNTRFQPVLSAERPHMEFAIPATPWFANQKETPKLLFFSNHILASDAFDFTRRFKSDAQVIEGWRITGPGDTVYAGYNIPSPVPMTEKLLKEEVDVIFVPGFINRTMPAKVKKQFLDKVKKGCIVIYVSDHNRFTDLFPRKGGKKVPAEVFRGIPFKTDIREYKVGKGKVFFVPFRLHLNGRLWSQNALLLPAPAENAPHHEHVYALYCRLLRYALGYKSAAIIQKVRITGNKAELTVNSSAAAPASLNGKKYTLKKGTNKLVYSFKVKDLNGKYDLPLILDVKGKTSDIFIAQYTVKNLPALNSFATAKYAHESKEAVKGSLVIEGKGDLSLSLLDAENRVIGKYSRKGASGKVNFSITPAMFGVNSLCRLEAVLSNGKKTTDIQSRFLSRRTPDNSRLNFVLWHNSRATPTGMLRHAGAREMGFTHLMGGQGHAMALLDSKLGAEAIQQTGARYMVNTLYRFFQNNIRKEKRFRNPCLRDPAGLKLVRAQTRLRANKHVQHFPVRYYSSDENSLGWHDLPHDYCRTPHCLNAFRKAMQKHYGTLAKLNTAWKTSFKTWQQVMPPTLAEACKKGHFAAWMAHRIFMLGALDDGMRNLRDELHKVDPQAKLAHSGQGLTRLNECWDWRKMPNHYELSNLYATMGGLPDFLRTTRPGYFAGNWNGYGRPLPHIRFTTWNDIADGMFAPAYWYDCYFFRRGDNQLNAAGLHMKSLIAEIKQSGADPLMTTGKRVKSPFTLVYSPESLMVSTVTGFSSSINNSTYNGNLTGWVRLLRSAGYPAPQVIGDDMISKVTVKNTPVLVLPLLQLMSDAQIEHVRKYVLAGGTLVIDAQAGIFDEFYTLRKKNPLLTLAGVKVPVAKGNAGGTLQFGNVPVRLIPVGSAAEAAGAAALGSVSVNTPGAKHHSIELGPVKRTLGGAFFKRKAGKGTVIYINGLFHGVTTVLSDKALAEPLIKSLRTLFAGVGVRAVHTGGCDVNVSEYSKGRYRVLLANRRPGAGVEKVTYPLNGSWHHYDSIKHTYLGRNGKAEFALKGYDVKMLILTRNKLQDPRLKGMVKKGQFVITSGSDSGVWFARLFCDGKELKSLSRNVILDRNGKVEFNFGIAPKGKCEVRLLNIMNGKTFNFKADF